MTIHHIDLTCPVCGNDDLDAGTREGTQLIGCKRCGWPDRSSFLDSSTLGRINLVSLDEGGAEALANKSAHAQRAAAVGCDCGLDQRSCSSDCDCACHWAPVH